MAAGPPLKMSNDRGRRGRLPTYLKVIATIWFVLALVVASASVCVANLVGRVCFTVVSCILRSPENRKSSELARLSWSSGVMACGAAFISLSMAPFWRIEVIDVRDASASSDTGFHPFGSFSDRTRCFMRMIFPKHSRVDVVEPDWGGRFECASVPLVFVVMASILDVIFSRCFAGVADDSKTTRSQGSIAMCNHCSNADGFVLRAACVGSLPRGKFVYKASLNSVPFLGWAFRLTGDFCVEFLSDQIDDFSVRPGSVQEMMKSTLDHILRLGSPLIVFPEGVRSTDGQLRRFRKGFFRLAVENQIPIQAFAIVQSFDVWPASSPVTDSGSIVVLRNTNFVNPVGKSTEQLMEEVTGVINLLKEVSVCLDKKRLLSDGNRFDSATSKHTTAND